MIVKEETYNFSKRQHYLVILQVKFPLILRARQQNTNSSLKLITRYVAALKCLTIIHSRNLEISPLCRASLKRIAISARCNYISCPGFVLLS